MSHLYSVFDIQQNGLAVKYTSTQFRSRLGYFESKRIDCKAETNMRTISILIAVVLGITSDAMACKRQCYYVPCDNTPARVTALEQSTAALAKRVNDAE